MKLLKTFMFCIILLMLSSFSYATTIGSGTVIYSDGAAINTTDSSFECDTLVVSGSGITVENYYSESYMYDLDDNILYYPLTYYNDTVTSGSYFMTPYHYFISYYDSSVYETQNVEWSIKFTDDVANNISNVKLFYDTSDITQVTSLRYKNNNFITFNSSFNIPLISTPTKNTTFYWNYTYFGSDNKTVDYYTLVKQLNIDNCSSNPDTVVNFTVYDENYPTNTLNATVQAVFELWYGNGTTFRRNVSFTGTDNSTYLYCINYTDPVTTDAYFMYETDNGFTHRYYLNDQPLTDNRLDLYAYNYNDTTGTSDLRGVLRYTASYNYFKNVIAKMQRYYPGEDVWRIVQMDKSGDFGLVFFNIIEENTDYKFLFYDENNNLIKTTDTLKFACDGGVCDLTFLLDEYSGAIQLTDLSISYNYDNETGLITIDWNDPTGLTSTVRMVVTKETITGTLHICNITQSGSSGSQSCDISAYSGQIALRVYSSASPEVPKIFEWLTKKGQSLDLFVGKEESAFWTFGIMLTLILAGMFSPIAVIIMTIFSLIVVSFLGIWSMVNIAFITIAIVIGFVISIKVKR